MYGKTAREVRAEGQDLKRLKTEKTSLEAELSSKDNEISTLNSRIDAFEVHVKNLEGRIAQLSAELEEQKSTKNVLELRVQKLKKTVKDKDDILGTKATIVNMFENKVARRKYLIPALVDCLVPGLVEATRRDHEKEHPMSFKTLCTYSDADFITGLSIYEDGTPDGTESGMGFLCLL